MQGRERLNKDPELAAYAEEADVQYKTVLQLLEGGISRDQLADVLDLRNTLVSYKENGSFYARISTKATLKAYQASDGDLDLMEIMFTRVAETVESKYGTQLTTFDFDSAVYSVIDDYREGGLEALED